MAVDYPTAIREAGLRVTRPRLAVLAALDAHPHAQTESVLAAVREDLPGVSRQAVYDVLHALTDAGLIRRIQPSGHVSLYETRIADNHHHLVCRVCGDVRDVDCAVGEAPCLHAAVDHGFQIDEAEVIYWGVCPDCAAHGDSPRDPEDPGRANSSAH
ncbi:Fur family transcriptional regulator [Gordonia neofelifaecis]|uniref:Ferric-uptake regulator n=1 Tax=Gordonia neofelifaecis NRRL B-59395 TaxID=644548 RepID=F1YGS7_9ACTN|nr:Fur family transcriptional regulator [Gordonia neofelifaecis]EGD56225.1 ferric-uptake regulator [Gordonia neofelifaecis NRRL B-59395]